MMRMDVTGGSILSGGPSSANIRPRLPRGSAPLRFSWYTPFFISPHNPRTLYAGGNRVLKTTDRGTTWTAVSPELGDTAGTDRAVVPTGALTMLTESTISPGMLAGGTEGGRVWLTTNDGTDWRRIDAGLPRRWVSRVVLSHRDAGTVYVSFTGFREDDTRSYLFASSDTGRTWRSIVANLPNESINVVKEDPTDADILFVGTDLGVYVSRDRGSHWESLSGTLPSTPVQDLTIQSRDSELVIGTHGRGAWILDIAPIRDRTAVETATALRVFPVRSVISDYFPWETVPGDRRGRNVARVQIATAVAGAASIAVSDSTGRVVRRWQQPVTRGVNTVVWDMQAERAAGGLDDARPSRYSVQVSIGDARASGALEVIADPVLSGRPK